TVDSVHQLLGTANEDRIVALAGTVLAKDTPKALALLAEAADQGVQLGELLDQLAEYWRDLMVVSCAGADGQVLSVSGPPPAELVRRAQGLDTDTILAGMDVIVSAKNRLRARSEERRVGKEGRGRGVGR